MGKRCRSSRRHPQFGCGSFEPFHAIPKNASEQECGELPSIGDCVPSRYVEELKDVIRRLHGVEATHVESVPVKEMFQGQTVWEGIVEVFDLAGHATAHRVYAWAHETDDPDKPIRHVTVLHLHPIKSAQDAVRAVILQEARNLGTEES